MLTKSDAYLDWQLNYRERMDLRDRMIRREQPPLCKVYPRPRVPALVWEMPEVQPTDTIQRLQYQLELVDTLYDKEWINFVVDIWELRVQYDEGKYVVVWTGGRRRYR